MMGTPGVSMFTVMPRSGICHALLDKFWEQTTQSLFRRGPSEARLFNAKRHYPRGKRSSQARNDGTTSSTRSICSTFRIHLRGTAVEMLALSGTSKIANALAEGIEALC